MNKGLYIILAILLVALIFFKKTGEEINLFFTLAIARCIIKK